MTGLRTLSIFLLSLVVSISAQSQPVDSLVANLPVVAEFEEASAMDIDPVGIIYVADAGRHGIVKIDRDGEKRTFGGPGESEGQFDGPADIDVTNGLVLVVADAGNGRIQRFSREFLFLESLGVGDVEDDGGDLFGAEPAYRQRERDVDDFATGRPIALITTSDNEMYAIDESANVVLKWDNNRNIEQVIGDYNQGDGALIEPVSLALGKDGTLFVADRGVEAIVVYDAFGGFVRTMAEGLCEDVQSVKVHEDLIFIALTDKLLIYEIHGMPNKVIELELGTPLVDIGIVDNDVYILSRSELSKSQGLLSYVLAN